jgi:hypothetical protein
MANTKISGTYKEYATVDTAIDSTDEGFFTNAISPRILAKANNVEKIWFSVRETGVTDSVDTAVATVTLQFRCGGDGRWQNYYNGGTAFVAGDRVIIEDTGAGVEWRAGVIYSDYTSGSVTFGFDW